MTPSTKDKTTQHIDLRVGSAEHLNHLNDGDVDLVVSSPPYWNSREYRRFKPGTKAHRDRTYSAGFGDGSYDAYLTLMTRCFAEVFRVLKPGGICCVNIGAVLFERRMYPIPADLTRRLTEIGFELKEEIVWDKVHSACDRFGNFARNPLPHLWYPNLCSERVLVVRKPGPRPAQTTDPDRREASRLPLTRLATTEICNDVWHIAAAPGGGVDHPAPFPQDLAARLILLYSHRGELVLDPFLGSGQTMIVARSYGRRFAGVDIESEFVEYARSRIDEPIGIRRRQIIPRSEHVENDPFLSAQLVPEPAGDDGDIPSESDHA